MSFCSALKYFILLICKIESPYCLYVLNRAFLTPVVQYINAMPMIMALEIDDDDALSVVSSFVICICDVFEKKDLILYSARSL